MGKSSRSRAAASPSAATRASADLLVTARVVLPKLDDEARSEFERFATAHPQPDPRKG